MRLADHMMWGSPIRLMLMPFGFISVWLLFSEISTAVLPLPGVVTTRELVLFTIF